MRPALAVLAALSVFAFAPTGQAESSPVPAKTVEYTVLGTPAEVVPEPAAEPAKVVSADKNAEPGWRLQARLYHHGGGGATGLDSLGCKTVPLRTVAIDPRVVPKRTKLFIKETVGMRIPGGGVHDGIWYATDTGGGIKGSKIDLYTGHGKGSMKPAMPYNLKRLTVSKAGTFKGCPPSNRVLYANSDSARAE